MDLLGGLGDDDHTQYHNNTRGDARYPLKVWGGKDHGSELRHLGGPSVGDLWVDTN